MSTLDLSEEGPTAEASETADEPNITTTVEGVPEENPENEEEDTAAALKPTLDIMMNGIKTALENTPPELSADLVDMGLILTGGGALLKNIDKLISKDTGLPVQIADDPLSCVAVGTGKALEQEELFSTMLSEY